MIQFSTPLRRTSESLLVRAVKAFEAPRSSIVSSGYALWAFATATTDVVLPFRRSGVYEHVREFQSLGRMYYRYTLECEIHSLRAYPVSVKYCVRTVGTFDALVCKAWEHIFIYSIPICIEHVRWFAWMHVRVHVLRGRTFRALRRI